ncbi:hypothetical protein FACS1894187_04360 [Synergistales bacterium]|nr:hypothetical protein FACS1894187_04360 [Synergistales bacterium]
MRKYSGWSGTDKELLYILKATLLGMDKTYPELSEREIKSMLCVSLASNTVQAEICERMAYEFEQGEDGSESRNKLNEVVSKYKRAE